MPSSFRTFFALRMIQPASSYTGKQSNIDGGGEGEEQVIFTLSSFARLVGSHLQFRPSNYWPGLSELKSLL